MIQMFIFIFIFNGLGFTFFSNPVKKSINQFISYHKHHYLSTPFGNMNTISK